MIPAEIAILLGLIAASVFGSRVLIARLRSQRTAHSQMKQDLRDALASGDHRKIDDFMLVYSDELSDKTREHLRQRRDELYIERNP